MTEITITANGKFYYRSRTTKKLTDDQIAQEVKENTYLKQGVSFDVFIKRA